MPTHVMDPRRVRQVAERWYPSIVDVMGVTVTQSSSGAETRSYDDPVYIGVRAYLQPILSLENRAEELTVGTDMLTVHLDGYYPAITDQMELLDDEGTRYEIVDVLHHGSRAQTNVRARVSDAGAAS